MGTRLLQTAALLGAMALSLPLFAMPRFALREGRRCSACHINPGGGALRTDFGRSVIGQQQLVAPWLRPKDGWPLVDPVLHDVVRVGTDLRPTVLMSIGNPTQSEEKQARPSFSVFPMQADIYAAVHLGTWATAVVDLGLLGSYEAYGLVHLPFANSYLRIGRFYPTYGTKLPNHRVFIREGLGFGPRDKDVGIEAGIEPDWGSLQLSVLNGRPGDNLLDDNMGKAFVLRSELRWPGPWLHAAGGLSAYYNVSGDVVGTQDNQREDIRFGTHAGLSLGRLTYLVELDVARVTDRQAQTQSLLYASYHELSAVVVQGVEAALIYEFVDSDIRKADTGVHRLGAEISVFPFPYGEIFLMYRVSVAQNDNPAHGLEEALLTLHLYL